ncbi:restriction endonuclease subunit S [Candidatus Hepatoplasma crinochetorum]|uniref:restriction endonuclease subunit S n=1 Tax=Candidatus Hepatoplasma crinochetorum TaxID=295596 RepID=UPI00308D370B|nr:MAG: type I restriction endonuclease subunit S [Candidatus Hepatoplasma crinochetorum]
MDIKYFNKKIDELFDIKSGLISKNKNDFLKNTNSNYIQFKSIFKMNINTNNFGKVKIKENENQNLVEKNDLLINMTSENYKEVGYINIYENKEKVYLNSFSKILRIKNKEKNYPKYFNYLFQSSKYRNKIIKQSQGITRINLSLENFKKIKINYLIDINKQKLIGDFFNKIDQLIEITKEKNKFYKELKKLFSSFIFQLNDKLMDIKEKKNIIDEICFRKLSNNSIKESNFIGRYPIYSANKKILGKIEKYDFTNFIAISKDGTVGNPFYIQKEGSIINTLEYIFPKKNIDIKYLFYLLQTINFKKYEIGTSIKHIYFNDWKKEKINLIDIKKQKLIGDFFNKIDQLIENNSLSIKLLNDYKKSFLNIIFKD